ncbi:YppG family protein [Cytobacillus sp. S13-E01]|uniref:YppG family protein n=1 Tax=Cytobacillus sp. S13-E01 TaxID=3031326 RepID=UPI0023D81889|nr:YppG family protein [Cytobacillus sp. S13-E01]MDF0725806.1 YppG family protein [Cytobacillus sp. S13-E01]
MFPQRQIPPQYRRQLGGPFGRPHSPIRPQVRPNRQPIIPPIGRGSSPVQSSGGQSGDLLSFFRKEDGKFDFKKIGTTASQMKGAYNQIRQFSPMITKFLGR